MTRRARCWPPRLVTNLRPQAGTANPATSTVLSAFQEGGFIAVNGELADRATLAIVVRRWPPYEGRRPRP